MPIRSRWFASLGPLLFCLACGPTDADRANMKEKMVLENARTAIWQANMGDCKRLLRETTDFYAKQRPRSQELEAWYTGLPQRKRDKLYDENKAAWDERGRTLIAMVVKCPNEAKEARAW